MSNTYRGLLCLLVCASSALAESPLIFGVRGGAPFSVTDSLLSRVGVTNSVQRFTIGPTLGVRLPLGFSVEGDALYTRGSSQLFQVAGVSANIGGGSWQFPVMAKYTGPWRLAPVVGAGVSVRHTNQFANIPSFLIGSGSGNGTSVGFVAGAGLRVKAGPVNITPELRYTYWGAGSLSQSLLNFLPLSQHEAAALVSLTF